MRIYSIIDFLIKQKKIMIYLKETQVTKLLEIITKILPNYYQKKRDNIWNDLNDCLTL